MVSLIIIFYKLFTYLILEVKQSIKFLARKDFRHLVSKYCLADLFLATGASEYDESIAII